MTRLLSILPWLLGLLAIPAWTVPVDAEESHRPNVVLIFTDDQGYADVGCFGAQGFQTPHLDRMAREGMRFTSFYVSQAVCGASRASLLTGCYANRIGMLGAPSHASRHGIAQNEVLIPEMLKPLGYKTALFGKWHLGHHPPFLPTRNGFDEYYGLPYSNDMWPYHPTSRAFPDLPMFENERIVNPKVQPADQELLTKSYTERAVQFIDKHHADPFFLYVAHNMPHVPLFVSEGFGGQSEQGLYGDVIQEIDWSVGQILEALQRHRIEDRTLVIFTTDNGPWLSYGNHAGSAAPLREGKGTTWEGGVRVPCIMRWPGKIPAGRECGELAATIDVLPTIAALTGAKLPEHPIDGKNIWPLMQGKPEAKSPHEAYYYYWGRELQAIRAGDWKLHFPHAYRSLVHAPGRDGRPAGYRGRSCGLELYHLGQDVGEKRNVAGDHPEVVARLQKLADAAREDLGDSKTGKTGANIRPAALWNPDATGQE